MRVQDLLPPAHILLDVAAGDKPQLIATLGRFLSTSCTVVNPEVVIQRITEREAQVSTGIGYGIAIPHCRIDGIERSCMVAARTATPIPFDALDDKPIRLVFMMVSPSNTSAEHGAILKKLSTITADTATRERLLSADTAGEFLEVITAAEDSLT